MKKVLSIIVTYNFEPWLDKCLQSLLNSSYPSDILVIDNKSSDDTITCIEQNYPQIKLIKNTTNYGFGKANNQGIEMALTEGYDYVFLINQDTWIDKDCLQILMHHVDPEIGILSPLHYDGSEKQLDQGFAIYIQSSKKIGDIYYSNFINAAFWLISTSTIKKVGQFSPIFYHYGEDVDFANRIRYFNLKIGYVKEAQAYHDRSNRIVTNEKFVKSEFVYFLTEACNINYSIAKGIAMSIGAAAKKSLKNLFNQPNLSFQYIKIIFKILALQGRIINTRKSNKKCLH